MRVSCNTRLLVSCHFNSATGLSSGYNPYAQVIFLENFHLRRKPSPRALTHLTHFCTTDATLFASESRRNRCCRWLRSTLVLTHMLFLQDISNNYLFIFSLSGVAPGGATSFLPTLVQHTTHTLIYIYICTYVYMCIFFFKIYFSFLL